MKCVGISIGNNHPADSRTWEQFIGSEQAETPLGKLLIALTEEKAWSKNYTVYANLTKKPSLDISLPAFLPEAPLLINDDNTVVLTVRGVEDALRTHIRASQEALQPAISILENRSNELRRASEQIARDKAEAAIVALFPEAVGATLNYYGVQRGLYSFSIEASGGPTFFAREINHEFSGGVARISCTYFDWYQAGDGIGKNQRHGIFWAALARAFAVLTLDIPEEDLLCEEVCASEKPWEFPRSEPYIVEKVIFSISCTEMRAIVEFGSDNLPARVSLQEATVTTT